MKKTTEKLNPYLENFKFIAKLNQEYLGINIYP